MKRLVDFLSLGDLLLLPLLFCAPPAFAAAPPAYLLAYNDHAPGASDTVTFYSIATNGALSNPALVTLPGTGIGGGFFAADRVTVAPGSPLPRCAYFSEATTNTIAAVNALTQTVAGDFSASATDNGVDNGIGMVMSANYLYATFSTSGTIATFSVQSNCGLQFLGDISPAGLNGGNPKGMALYHHMLVVTYGDGSVESFDISGGLPVSNGDVQNTSGFPTDNFPDGVVISANGHYAIFGDDSSGATIEVSDISSGRITSTVLYSLPAGLNSNNVLLSRDGTLLYIAHNTSGQVSAAFFNPTTGALSYGCTSAELKGFDSSFSFLATLALPPPPVASSVLYVAEFGHPSAIGIINVSTGGGTCTLTETPQSPVADASNALLSIGVVSTRILSGLAPH